MPPILNQNFANRQEISSLYGGSTQSGIETPANANYILLFSSPGGADHGYKDGFDSADPNRFFYTGTGQTGDMEFTGQPGYKNGKIRDHEQNNDELWLFCQNADKTYSFKGSFRLEEIQTLTLPDADQNPRQAIRFVLYRV